MKIIHMISGGDVGGAKTHVHSLIKGLLKTEEVELVCFMDGPFAQEARELGIPTTVMTGNVFDVLKRLEEHIKSEHFQIIHCHGSRANMMGALLKNRCGLPIVTTVHSDYRLDYLGRPIPGLVYGTINALSLRRFTYHIGVSDPIADMLISRGFDPLTMFSIYNGVDFTPVTPKMTRAEYFDSVGLKYEENSVVFGIAARISPVKDMPTLIKAFAKAVQEIPSIRLVIAGDGEDSEKVKALADELCPKGTVVFAGWVTDMDSYYNAIDVNTLTSLSETFPYALTEGARKKCATIASSVGGVPILIANGVSGLLFEPGDFDTLAQHMILVASNEKYRKLIAEKLYESTKQRFSIDATVNRQKEIYASILRREARGKGLRDGAVICGAYGLGNEGDGAILESIVAELREIDGDMPIYVLSRNKKETAVRYRIGAINSFNVFSFAHRMRKAKLYISGGGTLIQDVTSTRSLMYYLANIIIAHLMGCKVMMYGCGLGPISKPFNRRLSGSIINKNVDMITLRDERSLSLLKRLKVTEPDVEVTADPVMLLKPADGDRLLSYIISGGLNPNEKYILFSIKNHVNIDGIVTAVSDAAEYFHTEKGYIPVFFVSNPIEDQTALDKLIETIKCPYKTIDAVSDSALTIGMLGKMSAVVSMRMHPLVFASLGSVPITGIVYDPKVKAFLERFEGAQYLEADSITANELIRKIESSFQNKPSPETIESLRISASRNGEIAKALLED